MYPQVAPWVAGTIVLVVEADVVGGVVETIVSDSVHLPAVTE